MAYDPAPRRNHLRVSVRWNLDRDRLDVNAIGVLAMTDKTEMMKHVGVPGRVFILVMAVLLSPILLLAWMFPERGQG